MNPFEGPPKPKSPEPAKPKNQLNELFGRIDDIVQRKHSELSQRMSEEMRAKLGKKIFYEGTLVKNLWNHLDDKWRELHKDEFRISDKGQMSPDLVESRNQYIESIDPQKLRDILDQWANDFEELAAAERDEQEKKDMYDSIDAVRELQNRMANW